MVTSVNLYDIKVDIYATNCFGFNVIIPFDTSVNIGVLQPGNYQLEYRGIIDTNTIDSNTCYMHPAFIPFDSSFIWINVIAAGISSQNTLDELLVYSDPSSGNIIIRNNTGSNHLFIRLLNISGIPVYTGSCSGIEQTVRHDLPAGVYFLQVMSGEKIMIRKLVLN